MGQHHGVEKTDLTTGKLARVFSGAFDILKEGPNEGGAGIPRPCRAIVVPTGGVTIEGLDGVEVVLPDMGGAWQWDLQATAIVSGAGVVLY